MVPPKVFERPIHALTDQLKEYVQNMRRTKIFAGNTHPALAHKIAERLGMSLAKVIVGTYKTGETRVEIHESVRDEDVYIIQSCCGYGVNNQLMELLVMIHDCRIASAQKITVVLPYMPYCKQSKKKKSRGGITAKLVANMLHLAGVDHIVTLDLHASQIQGFFNVPVDNLFAEPNIVAYIRQSIPNHSRAVVVAKNTGAMKRATSLADRLKVDFALIHKETDASRRIRKGLYQRQLQEQIEKDSGHLQNGLVAPSMTDLPHSDVSQDILHVSMGLPTPSSQIMNNSTLGHEEREHFSNPFQEDHFPMSFTSMQTGSSNLSNEDDEEGWEDTDGLVLVGDVHGRPSFLVDDMLDSCELFHVAAHHLKNCGATHVFIIVTHAILSSTMAQELNADPSIDQIIATNSVPMDNELSAQCPKLQVIDVSATLAEAIRRIHNGETISQLFGCAPE